LIAIRNLQYDITFSKIFSLVTLKVTAKAISFCMIPERQNIGQYADNVSRNAQGVSGDHRTGMVRSIIARS